MARHTATPNPRFLSLEFVRALRASGKSLNFISQAAGFPNSTGISPWVCFREPVRMTDLNIVRLRKAAAIIGFGGSLFGHEVKLDEGGASVAPQAAQPAQG